MSGDNVQEIDLKELAEIQKTHLDFLENLGAQFQVSGVPIIQSLTYEMIQIFNNIAMVSLLGEGDNG